MTIERLQELVGNKVAGTKVQACEVEKNNGTKRIAFQIGEGGTRPCVYVDDILRQYEDEELKGGWTLDQVAREITDRIVGVLDSAPMKISLDRERIIDGLFVQVINAEKNEDVLKDAPHKRFLDLAVIVRTNVDPDNEMAVMSTVVNDYMVDAFDLDKEKIFETAMKNTKSRAGFHTISMAKFMSQTTGMPEEFYENDGPQLTILTNRNMVNGASALAFPEFIQAFAEEHGTDLWVLPSSIHEVMLLPKIYDGSAEELAEIVGHANQTVVFGEDFLSGHVYEFNRQDKELRVAV